MEYPTKFDLQVAVQTYISAIDRNRLLDQDEREELFDHLMLETESLLEGGLTEEEAFTVSKLRFGESALISQQYEQVKPFAAVRKYILSGIMLFFIITGFSSVLQIFSLGSLALFHEWNLSNSITRYLDLGAKMMVFGFFLTYAFARIKRNQVLKKYEFWLVPLLGLLSPLLSGIAFSLGYNYLRLAGPTMSYIFLNNKIITGICMVSLALIYYILLYKRRTHLATN